MPITPNQLVALNLKRIRKTVRQWTQEQAAERLEPYTGTRLSKANWSAMESTARGKRVRQFDADLLVALSCAFEVPLAWFLLPARDESDDIPSIALRDASAPALGAADVVRLLYPADQDGAGLQLIVERLNDLGISSEPVDSRPPALTQALRLLEDEEIAKIIMSLNAIIMALEAARDTTSE